MYLLLSFVYVLLMCQADLFMAEKAVNNEYRLASANWIRDLPNYEVDLKEYKEILYNILLYFNDYKSDMNLNTVFGLRMIRANFKHSLANMGTKLSLADKTYINSVIDRADNLMKYFKKYPPENLRPMERNVATVVTATDCPWWRRLKQYDMNPFELKVGSPLSLSWDSWELYSFASGRPKERMVPSTLLCDFCMNWLADDTSYVRSKFPHSCRMPPDCMTGLLKGTDFGLGLGYRILMMVFANIGKNCRIIAPEEDSKMIKKLCQLALREIIYIADHNFGMPPVIMGHIFLCGTQGYTQFMNRTWIHHSLKLQTAHGCFVESSEQPIAPTSRKTSKKYVRGDRNQVGRCDVTATSIASASMAATIRFILESYY